MIFKQIFFVCLFFQVTISCISVQKRNLAQVECVVGKVNSCPAKKECARVGSDEKTACVDIYLEPEIIFQLPFDKFTEVICTQSPKNPNGSHGFINTLYAMDLTTPYNLPPSIIRAAADGKAFVFNDCKTPKGAPANSEIDNCGLGFGNHVRVLHKNGIISLYVHFEKINIKNGEQVKTGDALGTEGWTGLAGHRHLHFDVHKLNGATELEWEKTLANPGWGGVSIPYYLEVSIGEKKTNSKQ